MPGLTGLVVDVAREGAFAAAVRRLLADPELRRAMARRAEASARSHTWNAVLDQLWYGTSPAAPAARPALVPPAATARAGARGAAALTAP
jgi:hypothetical protein